MKMELFEYPNEVVIDKFKSITGIEETTLCRNSYLTSDMAYSAGKKAIETAGIDPETLDYIIMAHNFGDLKQGAIQSDTVPSIASRVKHKLRIQNPKCVAYDILFGCPGWVEGVLQAYALIKAGMAKKCLVIGAETLSRVVDEHDRDSMIYSDGAGATILEATNEDGGILSHESATFTYNEKVLSIFSENHLIPMLIRMYVTSKCTVEKSMNLHSAKCLWR